LAIVDGLFDVQRHEFARGADPTTDGANGRQQNSRTK
jgi:hypothetical protein